MKDFELLLEATAKEMKQGIADWQQIKKAVPFIELPGYNPNKNNEVRYAFKQFKTLYNPEDPKTQKYKGMLFPLFIKNEGKDVSSSGIKLGKWYRCGQGALQGAVDKNGKPVKYKAGDLAGTQKVAVNSKLGKLSYRPGWHIGSSPLTRHIGAGTKKQDPDTGKDDFDYMHSQCVWAVVEFSGRPLNDADTHGEMTSNGIQNFRTDKEGKDSKKFKDGYYHFKTNSSANADEDWIIADAIKVVCVLNDEETKQIAGPKSQKRAAPIGSGEFDKFSANFEQFKDFEKNKNIQRFLDSKERQEAENRREQGEKSNRDLNHEEKAKELKKAFSDQDRNNSDAKIEIDYLKKNNVKNISELSKEQKKELRSLKAKARKNLEPIKVSSVQTFFNY